MCGTNLIKAECDLRPCLADDHKPFNFSSVVFCGHEHLLCCWLSSPCHYCAHTELYPTLHVQYVLMYVCDMESNEWFITADMSRRVREGHLETCRRASLRFIFGYCPLVSSMNTAQTPLSWSMSTSLITEVNGTQQNVAARQVSPNFRMGIPHLLTLEEVVVVVNIWKQLQESDRTNFRKASSHNCMNGRRNKTLHLCAAQEYLRMLWGILARRWRKLPQRGL